MANRATAMRFLVVDYDAHFPRGATDSTQLAARDFVPPERPHNDRLPTSTTETDSAHLQRQFLFIHDPDLVDSILCAASNRVSCSWTQKRPSWLDP